MTSLEVFYGMLGKEFSKSFQKDEDYQAVRLLLLRLGLQHLQFVHNRRKLRYDFICTRYNIFPKPKKKPESLQKKHKKKPKISSLETWH